VPTPTPYRRPSRVWVGPSTTSQRIFCLLVFAVAGAAASLGWSTLVSGLVAAVCLWGMVHRTSLLVDLDRGVLSVPVGFLGWSRRLVPFAHLTGVELLSRGPRASIAFVGKPLPGHMIPEKIVAPDSRHDQALAQATRVATLLGLPLDDGLRHREAQLVDESLRERVLRTGADASVVEHDLPFRSARSVAVPPTAPAKPRTRIVVDGQVLRINAPGPRAWVVSLWLWTLVMVAGVASAVVALDAELSTIIISVCVIPAACVFGLLFVLSRGWRLTLDRQTASVRHLAKVNRNIPLVELIDLLVISLQDPRFRSHDFVVGGAALAANTKDGLLCFGHGCPKAELEWVAASVRHHILVTA